MPQQNQPTNWKTKQNPQTNKKTPQKNNFTESPQWSPQVEFADISDIYLKQEGKLLTLVLKIRNTNRKYSYYTHYLFLFLNKK